MHFLNCTEDGTQEKVKKLKKVLQRNQRMFCVNINVHVVELLAKGTFLHLTFTKMNFNFRLKGNFDTCIYT